MSIFPYPVVVEAKIAIGIPAAPNYTIRAWELRLHPGAANDPATGEYISYPLPEGANEGFLGLVWDGSVRLVMTGSDETGSPLESGLGVFAFDRVASIELAVNSTSARVAIIGILGAKSSIPDMRLPGRGAQKNVSLPMAGTPDGGQILTAILRQLLFSDENTDPNPLEPELWPRPGFFLTTIDGPRANDECPDRTTGDEGDQLDFIPLPAEENVAYRMCDPKRPLAYIIDFHAEGDDAPGRSGAGGTEPGCTIRCWGP